MANNWITTGNSGTCSVKYNWPVVTSSASSFVSYAASNYPTTDSTCVVYEQARNPHLERGASFVLPDGSRLHIDADGNYHIDDSKAVVVYKANRIREFSPYLNASDMLAKFIEYVGSLGKVCKEEALGLPIKLFISWLIIKAAERDGDAIPADIVPVSRDLLMPRCLCCGRFIRRSHARLQFPFCSPEHAMLALESKPA